jgi:hypothetical protein
MLDATGFPPFVASFPDIDRIGANCRVSPSVTVMRNGARLPERGIVLSDKVILFDHVRLLIGNLSLSPQVGLTIGDRAIINVGGYISGEGGLIIEDDVLIGPHVHILSAGHAIHGGEDIISRNPITREPVHIGAGARIGGGCTVLQGVQCQHLRG